MENGEVAYGSLIELILFLGGQTANFQTMSRQGKNRSNLSWVICYYPKKLSIKITS